MLRGLTALALLTAAGQASAVDRAGFCERMAAELDMKPVGDRRGRSAGEWRVNALSTAQRLLIGGSSMISFAARPVGDAPELADYRRLQSVCRQEGKEILCRVEGPMVLTVSAGKGKAEIEASPGERAEVGTKGSRLFCRGLGATDGV